MNKKQNWANTRLFMNAIAITSCKSNMYTKLFAILLVLSTCEIGKAGRNKLVDLNEDNWQLMLSGEWMVEFYAPWCPACKNLAPTWERYADLAADVNVNVAKIDVTTSPSLSGRFFVTALPTIYHVKNGDFRQYRGSRDSDALLYFVKQKQWEKIEPISTWKKPNTIHMSILSYFFKLSHVLKDLNTHLQEEYGLPTWGSYGLFAFGTIFVGAALGLLLVCVVDAFYPPKKSQRQSFADAHEQGVEDLIREEIEDENVQDNNEEDDLEEDDDDDDDGEVDENENSNAEEEDEDNKDIDDEAEDTDEKVSVIDIKENDEKKKQYDAEQAATIPKPEKSSREVRKRKPRKD